MTAVDQGLDILMLGTAEWNSPIATNQHYVVRELAMDSPVTFTESLGLRRPKVVRADLERMAKRVRAAYSTAEATRRPVPANARVVSPLIAPVHRAPTRIPNGMLLRRALRHWQTSTRAKLLWTFSPVTYGFEKEAKGTVYHCVDLLAEVAGIDRVAVSRGEHRLARFGATAIATSNSVADHLRGVGFDEVILLPNVADTSVFVAASRPAAKREPTVVFGGNLSPHKIDMDVLRTVAEAVRGRARLVLAGPVAAGGGSFEAQLDELTRLGADYRGLLDLQQLAELTGAAAVGIIPYADNAYNRGVSPLKCYEYLASGLAVVGSGVPEIDRLAANNPHVEFATDPVHFTQAVLVALGAADNNMIAERQEYARAMSWDVRGTVLRDLATKTAA
ncbi:glycosyltransferase [Paractinoplanes maris]|uniref:glycosyltransferase n=1 Tax=Paractinoplanes maris TaxID=1734446 RepID=UPI00201FD491|nr:glycosyltransferase [Actinoplanes maris]